MIFIYAARAIREPRKVLAEFDLDISDATEFRVHDGNADLRYLVLPMRPAGIGRAFRITARRSTRDCLLGTASPRVPREAREAGGELPLQVSSG